MTKGLTKSKKGMIFMVKENNKKRKPRPRMSAEEQENYMISLATDLAEKQLREGTAKSQVIVHYLKLGTLQHEREMDKLEQEVKQLRAKTEAIESSQRIEDLYADAIAAVRRYQGVPDHDEYD